METYGGRCGSCVHLNIEKYTGSKDRCYCTERGFYVNLRDAKCNRYEYEDDRDYRYLNNRWYIVTEICKKLGLSDEYECVVELFRFRSDVLEKDPKYQEFLREYDALGPFLNCLLMDDEDSYVLSKNLFRLYLSRVSVLIMDKQYDEALRVYIEMLQTLKNVYGVETERQNSSIHIKMNR